MSATAEAPVYGVTLPRIEFPDDLREPPAEILDSWCGRWLYVRTAAIAYADAENDWVWAHLCAVIGALFDPIAEMVLEDAEGNPGWTALASPRRCPSRFFIVTSQWAGLRRWDAMTEEEAREVIIRGAPGVWAATQRGVTAAVRRFLPADMADRYLFINPRVGDNPYRWDVYTYTFVDHDEAEVRRALLDAVPAGRNLTYEVRRGQMWAMLRDRDGGLTWGDVKANYESWRAVAADHPISTATSEVSGGNSES